MQYLTYEEYTEIGGTLDLTAFNRNIVRASGVIDNETHNRVANMSTVPDEVKHCVRDLVEYLAANFSTSSPVTSRSQSAGAVSESVSYGQRTADDIQEDISNIVYDYLQNLTNENGTPLLYRGSTENKPISKEPIKVKFQVKYGWNEIEIPR